MCIVMFSGIHPNEMVENGLDIMAETIGNATDDEERNLRAVPRANSKVNRSLVSTDGARRDQSQQRF